MTSNLTPTSNPVTSIPFEACWYFLPHDSNSAKNKKSAPCLRWGHSTAVSDKSFYVYGGTGPTDNPLQWENLYKLDIETWDWSKVNTKNKIPRSLESQSSIAYNNNLYFFGGTSQGVCQNMLMECSLKSNMWRHLPTTGVGPSPREGHSSTLLVAPYMLVYGGWSNEESFNDYYILDLRDHFWLTIDEEIGQNMPPRESHSCCTVRNKAYFFGGQGNNLEKNGEIIENYFNDLHTLQLVHQQDEGRWVVVWEEVKPQGIAPSKRGSHSTCAFQDRYMFVIGGEGYMEDYEKDSAAWNQLKMTERKKGRGGKLLEQRIEEFDCYPKNDIWGFDVEVNSWFRLTVRNEAEFTPRFYHKSDACGDFIIIFGGMRDYNYAANNVCILSLKGTDPFESSKIQSEVMMVPRPEASKDKATVISMERSPSRESIEEEVTDSQPEIKDETSIKEQGERSYSTSWSRYRDGASNDFPDKSAPSSSVQIKEEVSLGFHEVVKVEPSTSSKFPFPQRVTKLMLEKTAEKLEKTIVTSKYAYKAASMITAPLSAFGLFVDNASINKASTMRISYSVVKSNLGLGQNVKKDPRNRKKAHKDLVEELKTEESSQQDPLGSGAENYYINIEDNGKGWRHKDFKNILLHYDIDTPESIVPDDVSEGHIIEEDDRKKRIKEYAFNLKAGGFRLGKTVFFMSKYEEEISIGMLSIDTGVNPRPDTNQVFYCSWRKGSGEYLTRFGSKYRAIIIEALASICTEDELVKSLERNSTRIVIMNVSRVPGLGFDVIGKEESLELVLSKKKADVLVQSFENISFETVLEKSVSSPIERSLRSYLSYFFLNSAREKLDIILNESPVSFVNVKEEFDLKSEKFVSMPLCRENLFDGTLVLVHDQKKDSTEFIKEALISFLEGRDKAASKDTKKSPSIQDFDNMGILLYYENRFLKRFEYPISGSYMPTRQKFIETEAKDIQGYVNLNYIFKPNLTRTDIANMYYSNYLFVAIAEDIAALENNSGKRKNEEALKGEDNLIKKVKLK